MATIRHGDMETSPHLADITRQILLALSYARLDETEALSRRSIITSPETSLAYRALGHIYGLSHRPQQAIDVLSWARALEPQNPDLLDQLGLALYAKARFADSKTCHLTALALRPTNAAFWLNLGNAYQALGHRAQALTAYRGAIIHEPQGEGAYLNLGSVALSSGDIGPARQALVHALRLSPQQWRASNNLANLERTQDHLTHAECLYRRSLCLNPSGVEALTNRGVVLRDLGQAEAAEAFHRYALQTDPTFKAAYSHLLYLLSTQPKSAAATYLQMAMRFGELLKNECNVTFDHGPHGPAPQPLKVGLVSGDLREHPVGYFLEGLLARTNPSRIQWLAYPSRDDHDPLTQRIQTHTHGWHSLVGLTNSEAAQLIRAQGTDVLIDLAGHTADNRLGVFSYKPAPVQITWLGYWASTGVTEIDYILTDPISTPLEREGDFTEKVWRLPHSRFCFLPPGDAPAIAPAPHLKNGYLTFGCFNQASKITDEVVSLWSQILEQIPSARLYLKSGAFDQREGRDHMRRRFLNQGIPEDRLLLEGYSARNAYFLAYQAIDVALDPFPYCGGTTTCEGLWMGVPVITLVGDSLLSRQGASICENAGLGDWVVSDTKAYLQKAHSVDKDRCSLVHLRENLRSRLQKTPLFDPDLFAEHFEKTLYALFTAS